MAIGKGRITSLKLDCQNASNCSKSWKLVPFKRIKMTNATNAELAEALSVLAKQVDYITVAVSNLCHAHEDELAIAIKDGKCPAKPAQQIFHNP